MCIHSLLHILYFIIPNILFFLLFCRRNPSTGTMALWWEMPAMVSNGLGWLHVVAVSSISIVSHALLMSPIHAHSPFCLCACVVDFYLLVSPHTCYSLFLPRRSINLALPLSSLRRCHHPGFSGWGCTAVLGSSRRYLSSDAQGNILIFCFSFCLCVRSEMECICMCVDGWQSVLMCACLADSGFVSLHTNKWRRRNPVRYVCSSESFTYVNEEIMIESLLRAWWSRGY